MNFRNRFGDERYAGEGVSGVAWINLIAGLWLIASPWIYGFFDAADGSTWNCIVAGILIALVSAGRLGFGREGAHWSWINALLGAWMIASPFIYGYAGDPPRTANSIIVGVIVLFVALSATPGTSYASPYASPWYPPYGAYGTAFPGWGYPPAYSRDWRRDFRGRGPRGFQRSDVQIRDAICERMADSADLDATDIDVTVASGVVTLAGNVPDRESRWVAEDLAGSVGGVRDVQNQLRVATSTPAPREMPRRVA